MSARVEIHLESGCKVDMVVYDPKDLVSIINDLNNGRFKLVLVETQEIRTQL